MAPSATSTSISTFLMSHGTLLVLEPRRQTNADLKSANEVLVLIHEMVLAYCSPFLILLLYYYILYYYYIIIPCEQRLLSCMAFSVYEVTREACLSRSWLMTLKTLKVMQKDKPLLAGYTYHSISVSFDAT